MDLGERKTRISAEQRVKRFADGRCIYCGGFNHRGAECAARNGRLTVSKASLYHINNAIEAKDLQKHPLEEIVPEQYHEFLPLFSKILADRLPPHQPDIDHEGCLKNGEPPTLGLLHSMSRAKLDILKEGLKENMSTGFIRQSSSPFAAPVLFAKKPDGGLRFCIDYEETNSKKLKNWYPLWLIKETLNLLGEAGIYTTVDVGGAYNLLRVKEGDKHKLAFRTRYTCLSL